MTYAIWGYDLFPFICCGKTKGQPDDDGRVNIPSYGPSCILRPVLLVSDRRGKKVKEAIETARRRYEKEQKELRERIAEELGLSVLIEMADEDHKRCCRRRERERSRAND